ncbi:MAG: class I SAM-dependent methyltransferase [Elusimicrobia bacterium]|nr:class I SAM-dependent methyltransferase [Elusimicrobiota bacterium]
MLHLLRDAADRLLRLPELKGFEGKDFDAPEAAVREREIIRGKRILGVLYEEYCRPFVESARGLPPGARMLELGSGPSPLKDRLPGLICSDVVRLPWLDLACSAFELPFADATLDRIFALFSFHHFGRPRSFLAEARRCLKPGGELVLVDPAITLWSRLYYLVHVDRLDCEAPAWGFDEEGRLTGSNIALAWIVFFRDKEAFAKEFPELTVGKVEYNTCLAFLLSGGCRIRQLLPTAALAALFRAENWLIRNVSRQLAVTMAVTLRRA